MSNLKFNSLEQFLLLFNKVKQEAGYDSSKVAIFYEQKQALKAAVQDLIFFIGIGDFERRVFHGGKKYVPQAPEGFQSAWKEFKEHWESPLYNAWIPIKLSDLLPETPEDSIVHIGEDKGAPNVSDNGTEAPDPDFDMEFDPLHHDGGMALEMAFWITENYASEVGTEFEDSIHNASKIGLDAYDYLKNTIGFNASMAFRRWRQLPVIFVPSHVSNKHGLTEKGALYELLENAGRAYVFDAPAAAIAMCRAVLELVLKNHYELDYQFRDRKGKLREKKLGAIIVLAEEKYSFIQKTRLQTLNSYANDVMHNYSINSSHMRQIERIFVEYFKTIKFIVERAPKY